ncbi:MAG TPA: hypothetical protein VMU83_06710 [Hanamia sp.]|nr:hypothetical protein [Hanamia sp.]
MKKILFISAILLSAFCFKAKSQIRVNVNIGVQPDWGPVGYDYADYYYLPDLGVYYDVPRHLFVYYDFGQWNFAASLPPRFGHYDLYHSYKVVINQRDPWLRNAYYRYHYRSFGGRHQPVIRDSHDNRYLVARQHYEHERYHDRQEIRHTDHGRGHSDDHGRDHGDEHGRGHHDKH